MAVNVRLRKFVPNPSDIIVGYGATPKLRFERSATQGGAFAEITTINVTATLFAYEYWYAAGLLTDWFRTRFSDSGGTSFSSYDTPWSPSEPTAYATLEDVIPLFETRPSDKRLARLEQLLTIATGQVIDECGHRDYFMHPGSGTATWTADGNGSSILHLHDGFVSVSLVEQSFDGGTTYVTVPSTDYMLRGDSPYSAEPVRTGEPYFHLVLTGFGTYATWPPTFRSVRLTGVRGWPVIPSGLVESTAQRARQLAYSDAMYQGSNEGGPDDYGTVQATRYWPQSLWNFLKAEHERFMGCSVARRM